MVKPWYKQIWPWLLIAIPLFAILRAVHTVYLMNQQSPDLVVDEYYTEGKAINQNLAKYKEAASRNLQGKILLAGNKAVVTFATNAALDDTIVLDFTHATLAANDFQVEAQRSGESMYVAELPATLSGKWNLIVHDSATQWKLRAELTLPITTEIALRY